MSRLELIDGVVVFSPDRDADARDLARRSARELEAPRIAFFPDAWPGFAKPPLFFGADAYANSENAVMEAIAWLKTEDRSARLRGPWRVVYLGCIGDWSVSRSVAWVGKTVPITDEPFIVGRSDSSAMCLRQGGHSDQNTVARTNTRVSIENDQPVIRDAGSTHGTRIEGRELVVGIGQHLRIDGGATV